MFSSSNYVKYSWFSTPLVGRIMRICFQEGNNKSPFFKFEFYGCMDTGESKTLPILKFLKKCYLDINANQIVLPSSSALSNWSTYTIVEKSFIIWRYLSGSSNSDNWVKKSIFTPCVQLVRLINPCLLQKSFIESF